jgi:hypothetical protein
MKKRIVERLETEVRPRSLVGTMLFSRRQDQVRNSGSPSISHNTCSLPSLYFTWRKASGTCAQVAQSKSLDLRNVRNFMYVHNSLSHLRLLAPPVVGLGEGTSGLLQAACALSLPPHHRPSPPPRPPPRPQWHRPSTVYHPWTQASTLPPRFPDPCDHSNAPFCRSTDVEEATHSSMPLICS